MRILRGSLTRELESNDHSFGQSIDVNGNIAVIGSDDTPYIGHKNCGCVYIFKNSNGEWNEYQILRHPEPLPDSFFGWSVSLNEDNSTIVVGADDQDTKSKCAGAVYVFESNYGVYKLNSILYPSSENSSMKYFGFSVDAKQDMIFVGAPLYRGCSDLSKDGSAYLYIKDDVKEFTTRNMGKTFYGGNVKIAKDYYIVTAHREGGGVVYIYDRNFELVQKISEIGAKAFGKSIAVYNNYLLVGAPLENDYGAAYLYKYEHGQYVLQDKFLPGIVNEQTCFGYSVDMNKRCIAISDIGSHNLEYENYTKDVNTRGSYIYNYGPDRQLKVIIRTPHKAGGHCIKINGSQLFEGNPNVNNNAGEVVVYD